MLERSSFEKEIATNPTSYLIKECLRFENNDGIIKGLSGREISFQKNKFHLNLIDKEYETYHLKSKVVLGNICEFDLATKKEFPFHSIDFVNNRHPDFMASEYVRNMLGYYLYQNIDVRAIRSIWTNQSDNHVRFVNELKKTKDPILAAKSTYSGKLFSSLGYSHIPRQKLNMIYENELSRFPQLVIVDFFKE